MSMFEGRNLSEFIGRYDEALAAYRESIATWNRLPATEMAKDENRDKLASTFEGMGDLLAGCREEVFNAGCKPESIGTSKRDRNRIQDAVRWYERAKTTAAASNTTAANGFVQRARQKLLMCLKRLP